MCLLLTFVILPKLGLVIYCKGHFKNMYIEDNLKKDEKFLDCTWLEWKGRISTGPLDKHNKYDCLMGHSHSESNCNLHNTWLHISPSLKGTSLQKKYLPITPPDDLLFSSIHSDKPSLVSCFFTISSLNWHSFWDSITYPKVIYSKDSFWEVCSHCMICSIFLPIFQILVIFIEIHLVLALIYWGFIDPFPFFSIFGWNFPPTFEWFWIHQRSRNLSQPFCID